MFTRRCTQRRFLLHPDKTMKRAFVYCLGVAAKRHGMCVTSVCVMSNHYHVTCVDIEGNYPEFLRYFNSLLARFGNCIRGRWENFWATEQPGALHLVDPAAHLDKMVYTLSNPVKDHLVGTAASWPGVTSLAKQLNDTELVAGRPKQFFDAGGGMPERVSIRFARPPGFEDLSHEEWIALLQSGLKKEELKAAEQRRRQGLKLRGSKAVRRQSPFSQPKTIAKRRAMVPQVATRNKWARIEQLQRDAQFQRRYREAFDTRRNGDVDALFPFGTYQLRTLGLVHCEPEPASLT
jgi:putative transposase